jgi:hypothetical protein
MPRKNLTEYPTSWGDKKVCIFIHQGPAQYVPLNFDGDFPAGGDPVYATEAGMKAFDAVFVCGLSSGAIRRAEVVYPNGNTPGLGTGAVSTDHVLLRWTAAANMTELSEENNLSGETVRLLAVGPK